ncbi:helix-turn-helix domain-containing protein [Oscillospiraceae bacterium HV4-5-C5C]|nr:helix-turn-helix domain-containing protein [Oscillospiraceae bacterium HV4-5-C5C]
MLDTKKVGVKISSLRKATGYSQEKLANMLHVSPQAISKWENGHSLPETLLLPVLAQVFSCTIDEIIKPAYTLDENIEAEKPAMFERQAEQIAKYFPINIKGDNMVSASIQNRGDKVAIEAIAKYHPNLGIISVVRGKSHKTPRYTDSSITVTSSQRDYQLIERVYAEDDPELHRYNLLSKYLTNLPLIYHIDPDERFMLMEDLSKDYIQGYEYDEQNENGNLLRSNYHAILRSIAKLHATFWEHPGAFREVGLDFRLKSKENLLAHINGMEQDFLAYKQKEEDGKIPKAWGGFENKLQAHKLTYFQDAINKLRSNYVELIDSRYRIGKAITIIHGDFHPGNLFMGKSGDQTVKLIDLQAVRVGLCTEDLAMLLALHIEPEKENSISMLEYYYQCLCETVVDYSYEDFLLDYKLSIMESMFYPIKLMNRDIFDFNMRDKAIKAFESFAIKK